ncbi:MAG: hypothetical protein NT024_05600 [Proteobacteria bacterium]|nr:hypothetical protein [Pseudomonadota bacterium]
MNPSLPAPHIYRRRPTPWPIRIFLVIAVLFGIWVDVNEPDWSTKTSTAERMQTQVHGSAGEHSVVNSLIQTLASRR